MRCRDAELVLALYLDERRGGPLPADVDAHLAACPACHDEWMTLRRVETLFARVPLAEPAPGFTATVLAHLGSAGLTPAAAGARRQRWLTRRRLLGGGLVLVLGLLLLAAMASALIIWGLAAYVLSSLVPVCLQDPSVINTVQNLLSQIEFWSTTLFGALQAVMGAIMPLLATGTVILILMSGLAYALTLSWGWLIGRVWGQGERLVAGCRS